MIIGFDIGGTKCAVITAKQDGGKIELLKKKKIETDLSIRPEAMVDRLIELAEDLLGGEKAEAIGVSCGGPLDSVNGIIEGPPNLPGWNHVEIVKILSEHFAAPVHLQNDANACAMAEWKFGAGKGTKNMIFLTFGTGLGAGLIIDGKLYSGTNDNAGEAGHIRLESSGPAGYGKIGSFEGFCSGNGIAQLGYTMATEQIQKGNIPDYYRPGMSANEITAKAIADAAEGGDETALSVYRTCGEYLGRGLSILIDILNPQCIVIGSIFARSQKFLIESVTRVIKAEALPQAAACCKIVPAKLGEQIGDYAAVATALLEEKYA